MTSASELFYNRRSRGGRTPEPDLGLDPFSSSDRDPVLRHIRRGGGRGRDRHRPRILHREDSDHPVPHPARHPCHRASQSEREIVQLDYSGSSESGTTSSSSIAASSRVDRLRLTRNDRLPGAVLQARARLLDRLRNISLTGSRQTTVSSGISWDELAASNDFRVINSGDWEVEDSNSWFDSVVPFTDLEIEGNQISSLQDVSKNKPPGLSSEVIQSLKQEIFKGVDCSDVIEASLECCICLERFWEGDGLIRLCCGHRFHPPCLEPWVRTCGDCPYCRANI